MTYVLKGEYDRAISDFNVEIEIRPDHATAYLIRGNSYLSIGGWESALDDFDNTVRLCPNYESDFIDRKFIHAVKDGVESAIAFLEQVIASPPESANDFYYLGIKSLYENDALSARDCFTLAERKGFEDTQKLRQHQDNLKNRKSLPRQNL